MSASLDDDTRALIAEHEAEADPHPGYLTPADLSASYQPLDETLTAVAGVETTADKVIYFTGADTAAAADLTAFGRSFISSASAAPARAYLELGTAAKVDTGSSGATVPYLSVPNTWSAEQTLNARLTLSDNPGWPQLVLYASGQAADQGKWRFLAKNGASNIASFSVVSDNYAIDTPVFACTRTAQMALGTESPNVSAKLQIDSTTQGLLPPRMTTTQRDAIASPTTGLEIYNTTVARGQQYDGARWLDIASYGWSDLLGEVRIRDATNPANPADAVYRGGLREYLFAVNDECQLKYHMPHDWAQTDIYLHVHWGHNATTVTGGSVTFSFEISYAKGHNQAAFSAPITASVTQNASATQYQHMIAEFQLSAASPSASQLDTDIIEVDGLILARLYLSANNMTVSGGGVPDVFVHYVDMHYESNGTATKNKAPNFYA